MKSELRYKLENQRKLDGEKLIEPYRLAGNVNYKSMGNLRGQEFQESLRKDEEFPKKKNKKDFNLRFFLNEQTESQKVKELIEKVNERKRLKFPSIVNSPQVERVIEPQTDLHKNRSRKNYVSFKDGNYLLPLPQIEKSSFQLDQSQLEHKFDFLQIGKKYNYSNRMKLRSKDIFDGVKLATERDQPINNENPDSQQLKQSERQHESESLEIQANEEIDKSARKLNQSSLSRKQYNLEFKNASVNQQPENDNPNLEVAVSKPKKPKKKRTESVIIMEQFLQEKQIHTVHLNNKKQENSLKIVMKSQQKLNQLQKEQNLLNQMIKQQREKL